jgi:signal transduction histidine kinase
MPMETPRSQRRNKPSSHDRSFLSLAAHELRTPLHSANGFLEMVLDGLAGPLNERQQEMLGYTHTAIGQLTLLLEDVLFMARADGGEMTLRLSKVDPAVVVARALESIREQLRATDISVIRSDGPLPAMLKADGERLCEGLGGLLRGAVAMMPVGGAMEIQATAQDGSFRVIVWLHGVRLNATDMGTLFDRFPQPHPIEADRPVHLGLELAIAQITAAWHDGACYMDSSAEDGSLILSYEVPINPPVQS